MPTTASNIVELQTEPNATSPVTPMMRQYFAIKEAHQDYLLFYRMGDFYELFFDDALKASEALDIALTHRGKLNGQDVPMCGVPHHNAEYYLHKLIRSGFKVAICEQMEDPKEAKKRGHKAVVRREVVRIVTSGTLTEENLLDSRSSNYLAALSEVRGKLALAWLDISTGEFSVCRLTPHSLAAELARIAPKELLISEKLWQDIACSKALDEWRQVLTPHATSFFESVKGKRKLLDTYALASLDGVGEFAPEELGACGALLDYVELTQKGKLPRLALPRQVQVRHYMAIDAATRRNLELTHTMGGEVKGSLLHSIDRTVSGSGARLLYQYIGAPLLDPAAINARLDMVQWFREQPQLRGRLREAVKAIPDMERALARLHLGRGSPRDLAAIREGLLRGMKVSEMLEFSAQNLPAGIVNCRGQLGTHDTLMLLLQEALTDTMPMLARDGGFIRDGYNAKLDDYRRAQHDSQRLKADLQQKYIVETGINTLKIKQNNILGYFIEITPQHAGKVPAYFTHRQTTGGYLRYTTQDLKELESRIVNASGYALELELELFRMLVEETVRQGDGITITAQALATLDVIAALAELAGEHNYCRPVINDSSNFIITGGRHPVVEQYSAESFIRNGCDLSEGHRLWLITGPNMAGKSTFLRQNALIAILAQMGSFVPAESAEIGVLDRVFSRVGAADNLARGQSTFMVEMVETAAILNQATERSLVILDEIGRGTATFDGLSIAWAVVEYLHDTVKCRGLFATHYHELTTLASRLSQLACYTMKVKEWQGDVVFLHEVAEGVADRSYGIHVAKLAGLPEAVLARASQVMATLQKDETSSALAGLAEDLPLFASCHPERGVSRVEGSHTIAGDSSTAGQELSSWPSAQNDSIIEALLNAKDIDNLSPREALEFLYTLKEQV